MPRSRRARRCPWRVTSFVESVFSIPGIGRYYVTSIGARDYSVIMAMTMLFATAIAVMNLVVDVLYAYIDPRIRYR
jgi:ABC-type dipeptide/oligopeptide/nickel transport system permease component